MWIYTVWIFLMHDRTIFNDRSQNIYACWFLLFIPVRCSIILFKMYSLQWTRLSEDLEALNGFVYVSDGVRWHRSAQFRRWCRQNDIELCDWPVYSANFNVIELVWNIIKQETKNKNPKSQLELENAMDEVCSRLSLNVVRSCIKKTQTVYSHVLSSY
jgi:hypothetical protein